MSSGERKEILDFLNRWKRAWVQKDLDRFIKMYHPDFKDGRVDYKMFLKSKQNFFRKYGIIQVELDRVEIKKSDGTWLVKFLQSFQGDEYRDKGWKTMVLAGEKGQGFRIIEENGLPYKGLPPIPVPKPRNKAGHSLVIISASGNSRQIDLTPFRMRVAILAGIALVVLVVLSVFSIKSLHSRKRRLHYSWIGFV